MYYNVHNDDCVFCSLLTFQLSLIVCKSRITLDILTFSDRYVSRELHLTFQLSLIVM